MRNAGAPASDQPEFVFREKFKDEFYVSVKKANQEVGDRFCEVHKTRDKQEWAVTQTYPEKYASSYELKWMRFESRELAAQYCYNLIRISEKITKEQPLPEDVTAYLKERSEDLRKEEQNALNQFLRIRCERHQLRKIAERGQIEQIVYLSNEIDQEKIVRELLSFEVHLKKKQVPLFSETALYALIGKEDARTVLAMVERVCNAVSPNITQELM